MSLPTNSDWEWEDLFKRRPIEPLDIEGIFRMRASSMDDNPQFDNSSDLPIEFCRYCLRPVHLEELDGWYYLEDQLPPKYAHRECLEMDGV